jgi:glycosyltransferase involved in cell wall biosynthesis
MQKKKILFIITKGSPFGGAQRYVYDLAINAPPDFEVAVACGAGEELPELLMKKQVRVIKIEKLVREVKFFDEFKVWWDLVKLFRQEKPIVVHLNSSKIGALGAVAARIAGVPKIIFTAHGWAFNETQRSVLARIFYAISHWLAVLLAHKTIAVSGKTKSDVSWMPFISNKIQVIHNGIEGFKLKAKKEARLFLAQEDVKKIIILSLSELHPNKGLDIALHAITKLPDKLVGKIIYCIAGSGDEGENLQQLANKLNISSRVRFLGFIPNAREFLAGTDIFLLPSRNENLPVAILEAGLAGLPIIATSVGGIPEIIDDMQNGILVHPRNPREIAEAIAYLLDNPEKAKLFKEKIKEKVLQDFSLDKMLGRTYSLYL